MLIEDDTEYSRRSSGRKNKCRYSPPTRLIQICGLYHWDQWTSNKCLTIWMRAIAIRTRPLQHLTPELSDSGRPVSIIYQFSFIMCIYNIYINIYIYYVLSLLHLLPLHLFLSQGGLISHKTRSNVHLDLANQSQAAETLLAVKRVEDSVYMECHIASTHHFQVSRVCNKLLF